MKKTLVLVFSAVVFLSGCGAGDVFRKTDSGIGPTIGDRAIIGVGSWGGAPQLVVNDYSTRIYPQGITQRSLRPSSLPREHGEGIYGDPHVVFFKNNARDTLFKISSNSWTEVLEIGPGQVSAPQMFPTGRHLIVIRGERQTSMGVDFLPEKIIPHEVRPGGRARIVNLR